MSRPLSPDLDARIDNDPELREAVDQRVKQGLAVARAERRERIATALAPLFAAERGDNQYWIADTCDYAEMLIAELDRREAADREGT